MKATIDKYVKDVAFSLAAFYLVIIAVNIFLFPDQPGFIGLNPHPYLIAVLLVAGRFGLFEALLAAGVGSGILAVYTVLENQPYFHWGLFAERDYLIPVLSYFIAALIVGEIRRFNKTYERALKKENEQLRADRERLKEQLEIVTQIKEELENRIIGQEETVHSLYQATKALETLEEKAFYKALTQLTARFTGATKVSLYIIDYPNETIHRVARFGYDHPPEGDDTFPLYEGIFDVILQMNRLLTIKDISDTPSYFKIWQRSKHRAYAYVPISMASVTVGILTVDDIPFLKLNISTIRILALIAELAVPALKNIIKFQDLQEMVKIDPVTGLLKYESFLSMASIEYKKSVRYKLDFSLVLLEVEGLMAIEEKYGHEARVNTVKWIAKTVQSTLRNIDILGLGERKGQFAMALPVTGQDGVLTVIERLQELLTAPEPSLPWKQQLRFYFGEASYHPTIRNLQDLLRLAKHSLELQKVSGWKKEENLAVKGDELGTVSGH